MKWIPEECVFGDVIRTKAGSVYHYGIFVSENEVIQFGFAPTYYVGEHKNDTITVCSCDIYSFMVDGSLEKGVPDRAEKKKIFSPQKIVENARKRLGEGGYGIVHNNCEHFVNECAFGKKFSEQEELLRSKWNSRSKFDVYFTFVKLSRDCVFPKLREKEIASVKNEKVREDKINVWKLLSFAIEKSFGFKSGELKFRKTLNGKWVADGVRFSLSHTDGCCAVVVSDSDCGIDIENLKDFSQKCSESGFKERFARRLGVETENEIDLIKCWTAKESSYKAISKGYFSPKRTAIDEKNLMHVKIDGIIAALVGKSVSAYNLYLVDDEKCRLLLAGDIECI